MIIHYTSHNSLQCSLSEEPFCDVQEILPLIDLGGREGGANSSCTYDRLAIAACSLADVTIFNLSIPIQYQVWGVSSQLCLMYDVCTHAHTNKHTHQHTQTNTRTCTHIHTHLLILQYFSDPNLGGVQETLDFCPINIVSNYTVTASACYYNSSRTLEIL